MYHRKQTIVIALVVCVLAVGLFVANFASFASTTTITVTNEDNKQTITAVVKDGEIVKLSGKGSEKAVARKCDLHKGDCRSLTKKTVDNAISVQILESHGSPTCMTLIINGWPIEICFP